MEPFQIVTEEMLVSFRDPYYYAGSKRLKEGDKIIFGFTIINNEPGVIPQKIEDENLGLQLNSFVLENNMLFQLYKRKI